MDKELDFGFRFGPEDYLRHTISTLTSGSKTGYQIMSSAPAEMMMGPTTVYRSLNSLTNDGFVEVAGQLEDDVRSKKPPRRLFRLTDAGAKIAGELGLTDELGVARLIHEREQFPVE